MSVHIKFTNYYHINKKTQPFQTVFEFMTYIKAVLHQNNFFHMFPYQYLQ